MLDMSYSKQEVMKTSEAMDTLYNQRYEQKILVDSFAIKLKEFQEKWDQRSKKQEEELQQLREIYHDKQRKILIDKQQKLMIDFLSKKLKLFQEEWYHKKTQEEEELQKLREKYHEKQQKIMIYSSANGLKVLQETSDNFF